MELGIAPAGDAQSVLRITQDSVVQADDIEVGDAEGLRCVLHARSRNTTVETVVGGEGELAACILTSEYNRLDLGHGSYFLFLAVPVVPEL